MATFAPYSAKRTAIAWPMPELPPVTSTFLPFSPRSPSVRAGLGAVAMSDLPLGRVPRPVPWRAAVLRAGSQRGRTEGDAEALAPDHDAAVAVEAHRARDRVVLRADVALEVAEVDVPVVERASRARRGRRDRKR